MATSRSRSAAILRLASRQHGVVSRSQLLAVGIASSTITDRIAQNHLFPVFPGVYLVGRPSLSRTGLLMASLLAAGGGAALGFRTAASVWGMLDHRSPVEVLKPTRAANRRAKVRVDGERWWPYLLVRETKDLPTGDLTVRQGLTLTSPERTLLDVAAVSSAKKFHRAFLEADRLGLLDDGKLLSVARRTQGRKGSHEFKRLVRRRIPGIGRAESLLEAIVLDVCRDGNLPAPESNQKTQGYRPDFRWPAERVIVEADGYEFHRGREAFENDVLRANRLRAEGWTVLRFTWRMANERPVEVARIIRGALASVPEK